MQNTEDLPGVVYAPVAERGSLAHTLKSMFRDLVGSRELSWRLFVRDLSAQYRQSFFGILWIFIPPIVTSLIFIMLQSRNIINFGETQISYPAYVIIGTLLWQIFVDGLNAPLKAATAAQPLLAKINFPHEALLVSSFYMVAFNALVKFAIIIVVVFFFRLTPTWEILLSPIFIFLLILLGLAVGILLTPIGLLYTDIASSLPILVQLAFFITPVVYQVPTTFPFSLIGVLNPVSPLLTAARDLLTLGSTSNWTAPLVVAGITILLLFIGWAYFRVALPIIIERMSA